MVMLAPVAAEVGSWTVRKILPWAIIGLIIAGLTAAVWVQTNRLHNAEAALKVMTSDRDLQKASAEGWQSHSAELQKAINDLNDQISKLAADKQKAQVEADKLLADQAQKVTELNAKLSQLKARANAHPDQVRPLGPIVNDVLDSMCGKASAADPSAACN